MAKVLGKSFFNRDVRQVARDLIGAYLVKQGAQGTRAFLITETEAYDGEHDLACHASKGRSARTEVLYGEPGCFYVYLCYGMHFMLNVVAREKNYPAGVLLRSVEGLSGPGKLTRALAIDKRFNGKTATVETGMWFEAPSSSQNIKIKTTARIGVAYAGAWAAKKYRFLLKAEIEKKKAR